MGGCGWTRLVLLAGLLLGGTGIAQAAPPAVGSSHEFFDPVFRGTIFCDTLDAVQAIASAAQPDQAYAAYYLTTTLSASPSAWPSPPPLWCWR